MSATARLYQWKYMASDKLVKCPKCGFNNRPKDKACLFCGLALAEVVADDPKPEPPATDTVSNEDIINERLNAESLPPSPAADDAPVSREIKKLAQRSTRVLDREAIAEEIGMPLTGGLPRDKEELGPSPTPDHEPVLPLIEEDDDGDEAADSGSFDQNVLPLDESRVSGPPEHSPKRGETTKYQPTPDGTLLYWIFCDPLEPIPLGYAREITAGRHHKNDLVLPHNEVSRFHAAFKVRGRSVTLEDLGSSNGVLVNGVRRLQHMISVGDKIRIGPYDIVIKDKNDFQRPGEENEMTATHDKTRTSPAYAAFSEENVALSGNLQDTPLSEVLQGFEFNQKTGTLVVIHRNIFGWFGVIEGRPHSAGFRDKHGVDAVCEMLKFNDGHFTFYNTEPEGDRQLNGTITGILLDASRREDEGPGKG